MNKGVGMHACLYTCPKHGHQTVTYVDIHLSFSLFAHYIYIYVQDPSEVFDIFEAPTPEQIAGAKVDKLPPVKGQKKRSLVHAEGDWHRYVWLACMCVCVSN